MLQDVKKLKITAEGMNILAGSIQGQAEATVGELKRFKEWGGKAVAALEERHAAIVAALGDSHAGLLAEFQAMDKALKTIIEALDGPEKGNG